MLDGLLYAVGGHDGPLVRKSVEVFNPDTNCWNPVADMNLCRRNAGKSIDTHSRHSPFFLLTSPLPRINIIVTIKVFGVIGVVEIRGGHSVRGVVKLSSLWHVCSNKWTLEKGT